MNDIERWLERYGNAWESADPDAAAELFTDDAIYEWGPYERIEGVDGIRERWRKATTDQGEVRFGCDLLGREGDRVFVHWRTEVDPPEGAPIMLDGAFVLDFEPDGRCRHLQEWWLVAERE